MHVNLLQQQEELDAVTCHQGRAKMTTQKGVGRCYRCVRDQSWSGIATEPCYVEASMISAGSPPS